MNELLNIIARISAGLAILILGFSLANVAAKFVTNFSRHRGSKTVRLTIIILSLAIACHQFWIASHVANLALQELNIADKSSYKLVFQDEFNGNSLDTSKWKTQFPWGRTHDTHYMTYFAPDAFEVADGRLRIKAEKRQVDRFQYAGGLITTFGIYDWRYGYFEMKAKLPKGKGLWPAFWLVPTNDWPPEIDIFELLGHEPNKVYLSNHWKNTSGAHKKIEQPYVGEDFTKDYHVFAVEWTPREIVWYIDDLEKRRTDRGVPQVPMCLQAALTIGGDWPGAPDRTTPFPAYMDIDFIRVFERK